MKHSKIALALTATVSLLSLTACNDNNDTTDANSSQGATYVSEANYGLDSVDNTSSIKVMTYNMTNLQGKSAQATALVLFPKAIQPKDGYRVVVWEHGTVGAGDDCAPSKNKIHPRFKILADTLLAAGYVIVAPDYEGLGAKGIHPYLNLQSEANSAIYAVKAVKEKMGKSLSGDWISIGQSQGGHASLGIAQYAAQDSSYKGTVATAPASSLGDIITKIAPTAIAGIETQSQTFAASVYAELLSYAAYTAAGIKAYAPDFDYGVMFQPRSQAIAVNAEGTTGDNGLCLGDMMGMYFADIQKFLAEDTSRKVMDYPAFVAGFEKTPLIAKFLMDSQPGTQKLTKPALVVQGKADSAVPYQVTEAMVAGLNALGSDPKVQLDLVEDAKHTEAIVQRNAEIVEFIKTILPTP